jgi:hypothetical protein
MPFNFTSSNQYVQVGVNHGNIYTRTDPIAVTHPQDIVASKLPLDHALIKAKRYLDVVQNAAPQNSQILGVVERLHSLVREMTDLGSEQWGSLENGVRTAVYSLLYCCITECYEFKPTPLAISSLYDQLDACNWALRCVHGAAIMYVSVCLPVFCSINTLTRSVF